MTTHAYGPNPVALPAGRLYPEPVQTLDSVQTAASQGALASPAVARNAAPILAVLCAHLPARARVLEIASGSGEHAIAFARALPATTWTPSDPSPEARASITAWRAEAALANLNPPLELDAAEPNAWPEVDAQVVFCANMIHISPWAATQGLMAGAGRILPDPGGLLVLYGPYREAEVPLAPSNATFDDSLKSRDPAWGLRELDEVVALARVHRLDLTRRVEMPANNLMLLFRRV
ncbi:DUF938 domain-containing protein [Brevundimonas sp. DC300-4]|uniref:DUF938 domain-containing protein n=1 Tax=Brevundimonas sp. DC300-4 TaxID=2804594 RepID=UPI003CE9A3DF